VEWRGGWVVKREGRRRVEGSAGGLFVFSDSFTLAEYEYRAVINHCAYSVTVINQCAYSTAVINQCTYSTAVIHRCTYSIDSLRLVYLSRDQLSPIVSALLAPCPNGHKRRSLLYPFHSRGFHSRGAGVASTVYVVSTVYGEHSVWRVQCMVQCMVSTVCSEYSVW
jgi:hypothetical protein